MQLRSLTIIDIAYRTWAKARLFHLHQWMTKWVEPEVFAGVQAVGASDAWTSAAFRLERAKALKWPAALSMIDLFKAF